MAAKLFFAIKYRTAEIEFEKIAWANSGGATLRIDSQRHPPFLAGAIPPRKKSKIFKPVRVFSRLSWRELVLTVCERLSRVTPAGRYKVDSYEGDPERNKQDCELKAFQRLARRLVEIGLA